MVERSENHRITKEEKIAPRQGRWNPARIEVPPPLPGQFLFGCLFRWFHHRLISKQPSGLAITCHPVARASINLETGMDAPQRREEAQRMRGLRAKAGSPAE